MTISSKNIYSRLLQVAFLSTLTAAAPWGSFFDRGTHELFALSVESETSKKMSTPFVEAAKKATPSVVSIKVQLKPSRFERMQGQAYDLFHDEFWERFFGTPFGRPHQKQAPQYGFGSGFIVSEDGYIMTNNHVIEGASKITVQLSSGKEYVAKKVGSDPSTDIALLKIEAKGLPALKFADSSQLEIGEWIVVIGNPLALRASVTAGVVSALGRSDLNIMRVEEFIQTDAAINRGNSGGAAVNLDGNVIGMATAIVSTSADGGNIGIGFAISSNLLQEVMKEIIEHGQPIRGYLGFIPQSIDNEMAKALGLSDIQGAVIAEIMPDSPAAKAGIIAGDVIISINDKPVTSAGTLKRAIALTKPGQSIALGIIRNGKEMSLTATVDVHPEASKKIIESTEELIGISVEALTPDIAKKYKLEADKGLLIVDVDPESAAYEAGLRSGYIIIAVNGKKVETLDDFAEAVKKGLESKKLLMQVKAGSLIRFFPVPVEE